MKTPLLPLTLAASVALAPAALRAQTPPASSPATPAASETAQPTPPGQLRFNFRGAPLETVLEYLSDAAGFVIVLETSVRGTVDMWSAQPVSRTEAVQLLNLALNKNGYTATLQGRNLIVSSKDDAKKRNIPIRTGNDPREIPANAEMVMQIIPLRHITAAKVAADIATMVPSSATVTANEDSNSLVVTDTNLNVRHVVEIVSALDLSVQSDGAMRIFKLANADPTEMANMINTLYQTSSQSGTGNAAGNFPNFGPFGGFPGGLAATFGRGGNNQTGGGGGSGRQRNNSGSRTATAVSAVADPRTQSVIVTASKDTIQQIAEVIAQLDASSARKQKVFVYTLENADVQQVETVLKDLFQTNSRSSTNTQNDPLSNRAANNNQQTGGNFLGNTQSSGGLR